jgi:spore maturation protein CgeB
VRTVYGCFDDPEASEDLSRPVASAYDVAMVGNVAELDRYRSWGVKSVHWWPLGFRAEDFDPTLDEARIRSSARDVDVALLCERVTRYRRARVDRFALAFPDGVYRGQGWPQGFLAESERVPLLQRTRVGINIHNSTGPINFRTFYLPANGVMQICDNKSHLASVFALGEEVVGYDTIDEAIDLCRFYLAHEQERQEIAIAGWKRTMRDYNEVAVFRRVFTAIESLEAGDATRVCAPDIGAVRLALSAHATRTRARRVLHAAVAPISVTTKALVRASRSTARNALKLLDDRRARTEHPRASATRTAGADSGATNA